MPSNVAKARPTAKSASGRIRNQKGLIRNQISAAMQKTRDLLPRPKLVESLIDLTGEPESNCRKMICGKRAENVAMLTKILRSEFSAEVYLTFIEQASHPKLIAIRDAVEIALIEYELTQRKSRVRR